MNLKRLSGFINKYTNKHTLLGVLQTKMFKRVIHVKTIENVTYLFFHNFNRNERKIINNGCI